MSANHIFRDDSKVYLQLILGSDPKQAGTVCITGELKKKIVTETPQARGHGGEGGTSNHKKPARTPEVLLDWANISKLRSNMFAHYEFNIGCKKNGTS